MIAWLDRCGGGGMTSDRGGGGGGGARARGNAAGAVVRLLAVITGVDMRSGGWVVGVVTDVN